MSHTPRKRARKVRVVTGMESAALSRAEFERRFREQFYDPRFDALSTQIDALTEIAWKNYHESRKSPRTRKAGRAFADAEFELPIEWLETRKEIHAAERRQRDPKQKSRILIVNGSSRSDQTCPGEASKSYRLAQIARRTLEKQRHCETDFLDLSRLASEYGRVIHPCKSCVSTAMPLCNWPCSCYPNHGLGQARDAMNSIYPRFAAAHGVMFVTPVNWYQAPSVLKLLIDRLVCADGGNPDPTSTGGKDPERAKELELAGWDYPRHLAGRAFAVVVHGDAAGVEDLRRILCDWLTDMHLIQAGPKAALGRYLGYFQPYATSHDDLDEDRALQEEVRNAALSLIETVRRIRGGRFRPPGANLDEPRKK
jgi:multimeric flavodoxin WrbA